MQKQKYMQQNFEQISRAIAYESIYTRGVWDNTTVMIVSLNRGIMSKQEKKLVES